MVVDASNDRRTDVLLHALADPTRRDIVRRTLTGEQSVSQLARTYPVSFAAIQKHVSTLERAGLVAKRRHGREQLVGARIEAIHEARQALDGLEELWRTRIHRIDRILTEPTQGAPPCP
ncbi:MAG: metalloregulator ArsR/SmtB family transcription factor [Candidatus Nanopelagicales bacterium]